MTTLDATPATKPCGCPELPEISRRSFLKAAGTAGVVAGLATEGMFTRLAFADGPYTGDVLVVLSFRGGMDGLQAFVPTGDPNYVDLRPTIAIPQSSAAAAWTRCSGCIRPWVPYIRSTSPGTSAWCRPSAWRSPIARTSRPWRRWNARRPVRHCGRGGWTGCWACAIRVSRSRLPRWAPTPQRPRSSAPHPSWRCGRSIHSTWTAPTTAPRRLGGIRDSGPCIKEHRASSPRPPSPPWTR